MEVAVTAGNKNMVGLLKVSKQKKPPKKRVDPNVSVPPPKKKVDVDEDVREDLLNRGGVGCTMVRPENTDQRVHLDVGRYGHLPPRQGG